MFIVILCLAIIMFIIAFSADEVINQLRAIRSELEKINARAEKENPPAE